MARSVISNLHTIFDWLHLSLPSFPVRGDQVEVLHKPDEFYERLLKSCSAATSRIVLASLYIGTGDKERALVNAIKARSGECGPSVKIKILLDNLRGSRGVTDSSRKLLLPLVQQNPHCQVALYHTPKLDGILCRILPQRYNELIGLQHMKIYVVDDDILISGANLSHDYFTNRQDRYILIKNSKQIADFFDGLVSILCDLSLQLTKDSSRGKFPPESKINVFEMKNRIHNYYNSFINQPSKSSEQHDTWIFPTIEIPPCDIHVDSDITRRLLQTSPEGSKIDMATGYFNLTEQFIQTILSSKARYNILVAHPTANGFYQSNGLSRYIPDMYTALTKQFYQRIERSSISDEKRIYEYKKANWTFHGKGIWITLPGEIFPRATVIGSSNYGARSRSRDLESQLIIVTRNDDLRRRLHEEQQRMFKRGVLFSRNVFQEAERKTVFWINGFVWLLKSFF